MSPNLINWSQVAEQPTLVQILNHQFKVSEDSKFNDYNFELSVGSSAISPIYSIQSLATYCPCPIYVQKVDQPRVLNEDVPPSNLNTSRRKSSRTRASLDPSASARVPQEPSKFVKETQSAARRLNGTPPYFKRER